ncbi:hypothetical protein LY78DRAFT_260779 [Colletotrichum sublineola]|nr:hypothetical protein LY78DRAFT_260779 [Colletotrichum sublineola]
MAGKFCFCTAKLCKRTSRPRPSLTPLLAENRSSLGCIRRCAVKWCSTSPSSANFAFPARPWPSSPTLTRSPVLRLPMMHAWLATIIARPPARPREPASPPPLGPMLTFFNITPAISKVSKGFAPLGLPREVS